MTGDHAHGTRVDLYPDCPICAEIAADRARARGIVRFPVDATEVSLSKSDGAYLKPDEMKEFLANLSAWAERMATKGYTIVADPDAGPGTMYWRAVR